MGLLVMAVVMGAEAQASERTIKDVNLYFDELTRGVGPCHCSDAPLQGPPTRREAAREDAAPQQLPKDFSLNIA
jgi:hypothetical protein